MQVPLLLTTAEPDSSSIAASTAQVTAAAGDTGVHSSRSPKTSAHPNSQILDALAPEQQAYKQVVMLRTMHSNKSRRSDCGLGYVLHGTFRDLQYSKQGQCLHYPLPVMPAANNCPDWHRASWKAHMHSFRLLRFHHNFGVYGPLRRGFVGLNR